MSDAEIRGTRGIPNPGFGPTTGREAPPTRVAAVGPRIQAADLPAGDSHLVLPEWNWHQGPMVFQIKAGVDGANLTGMGTSDAVIIESPLAQLAIAIINIGTSILTCSANDAGSPVNERFAAATDIAPGTAQFFISSNVGGEAKWYPASPVAL